MASGAQLWVSCFFLVMSLSGVAPQISDTCMQCLCEAVSGGSVCPASGSCHDRVCGPFAITLPYWQDAGRPTVGLDDRNSYQTYEKCALDYACSRLTIKGYMKKFYQDCNGDGRVDCGDYAQIHFHGGYGCNKPLAVPARNALLDCLREAQPQPPQPPVGPPPPTFETNLPDNKDKNDILEATTYPSIDIRFGDRK